MAYSSPRKPYDPNLDQNMTMRPSTTPYGAQIPQAPMQPMPSVSDMRPAPINPTMGQQNQQLPQIQPLPQSQVPTFQNQSSGSSMPNNTMAMLRQLQMDAQGENGLTGDIASSLAQPQALTKAPTQGLGVPFMMGNGMSGPGAFGAYNRSSMGGGITDMMPRRVVPIK